ncbi:MAG: tetraacyldisaccharide 4'-kinase [Deltaproteobacteria bacterium]|nr:tetraacyldisaccharide 4'-kinase [Deltaproteobacteria bacterium]
MTSSSERSRLDALWYGPAGRWRALGATLLPLSLAYAAGLRLHRRLVRVQRLARPVISVGNLTLGGSGKTPLVVEIAARLERLGARVAVVSRGYGRESRGPRLARLPGGPPPPAREVGDEPALIARRLDAAAVAVGEDRAAAARLAVAAFEPDVLVCDDAFQHWGLARDLDLLCVHAQRGLGNRRLFPAGPLREPVAAARRADLIVFTHAGEGDEAACLCARHGLPSEIPATVCRLEPGGLVAGDGLVPQALPAGSRVAGACAIAHPAGFFASLSRAGLELVQRSSLPDHEPMRPGWLAERARRAQRRGARALVVTEKDLVRIQPGGSLCLPLLALRLEAVWQGDGAQRLDALLNRVLGR